LRQGRGLRNALEPRHTPGQGSRCLRRGIPKLGQAEVQELGAGPTQYHVGWFEISMRDAMTMCVIQPLGDFDGIPNRQIERQSSACEAFGESLALDQLHDEEFIAIMLPDVVERADVGMTQRGDGSGFAFKSLSNDRFLGDARVQHLQRD
jgi:hypothetical protein